METLQLTFDEKNILESLYGRQVSGTDGYNPRKLDDVVELSAQEKKFFAGKNFVSPHFFVQTLYKVRGNLNPLKFNAAVNRTLNAEKNLRANFCNVGTRTLKVIQPVQFVKPEIIFRNLTQTKPEDLDEEFRKILEADMRRDFDLRHEPLIRFAVYRTSDEEFAVLVTLAQLINGSFNAEKFFAELFGTKADDKPSTPQYDLPPKNQAAVREYWGKVLDKAPPAAKLPFEHAGVGAYRQRAYRAKIPADILSDLRGRAQSNRMMLTAILQSAWGFMLHLTNGRRDCLFCQILSTNDAEPNVIPVRMIGDKNSTVEQLVRQQFRQLVVSQPYGRVDDTDAENFSVHDKKLFDHFLSFKEFQAVELNYNDTPAEECGKIISRNSWDAQGMKLGVYFRYSEKNLSVSFLYDEKNFWPQGIERLFELYEVILKQMLVDWNAKYADFIERLGKRVNVHEEQFARTDDKKRIRDFLSQLPILQGRYAGTIGLFDEHAQLVTHYEGDRISGDMLAKNFIFVVDGKLARNVDAGDGWYTPIDIVKRNGFVNPTSLLERQRLTLSAEVLTERVELLTIPRGVMLDALRNNSEVALSLMTYALEQMERWQLLWLQS